MEGNQKTLRYSLLCVVCALWICMAQLAGNQILIFLAMLLFIVTIAYGAATDFALPILLFFLPWSPVMKLAPGETSFFTIGLALTCIIQFVTARFPLNAKCIVPAALLVSLTLFSKNLDGSSISLSYLMFVFLLLLFPVVARASGKRADFRALTIFFSLGIIFAAISAQQLVAFPNIARYIDVYHWNAVTRYSGFYGDANFYSAHISAALSGVLLLLLSENSRRKIVLLCLLAVALLYCGLLAASKAFTITIALVIGLWLIALLTMKRRMSVKLRIAFGAALAAGFILTSNLFSELFEMIAFRFGQANNVLSLTTGRTERWADYLQVILSDPKVFFLGKGLTNVKIHGLASHSTPIQMAYQLGLTGSVLLLLWLSGLIGGIASPDSGKLEKRYTAILFIGAFLPWLSIDLLFFDEFFLLPVYVRMGVVYFSQLRHEAQPV